MRSDPAAQRVDRCARTDRVGVDTCRRAQQPDRRRSRTSSPAAPLPHGPTSATTTAPCDSMAACSVVAIHRRAREQHAWTGERRARGDPSRRFAGQRRVAIRLELPERARATGRLRFPSTRGTLRRSATQAPGRRARGIRSRDLPAEIVGRRHAGPSTSAELVEQCARARRVVVAHVRRRATAADRTGRRARAPAPLPCARTHADRESTCSPRPTCAG